MLKGIQLIQKYFKVYVPSLNILAQIDHTCYIILSEQLTSYKLFRDVVEHLQKLINEFVHEHYTQDEKKEFAEFKQKNEKERKSHKRSGEMKVQTSGLDFKKENNNEIIPNLYQKRIKYKPIKSLLDMIIFGGQFKKVTKFEDKQAQIDFSISLFEENPNDTYNKIDHIKSVKRSTPRKATSDMEEKPKFYIVKETPEISPEEFSELLDTILCGQGELNEAICLLIQAFSDQFLKGNTFYTKVFFFELLEGTLQNQIHAFEILFNVTQNIKEKIKSIHEIFQLFCEMASFALKTSKELEQLWRKVFPIFSFLISDKKFSRKS